MNLAKVLLDFLIGLLQCTPIGGICHDIMRSRSQSCQPLQFGLDACIALSTANPDHLCLILADQVFAPDFADATCASDDHIDTTRSIARLVHRQTLHWEQLLLIPLMRPIDTCIPPCIWW